MRTRSALRSALVFLLLSGGTTGAQSLPPGVRGPSSGLATRGVSAYLALERDLAVAIDDHDSTAADRLVDDGFRVRTPERDEAWSKGDWWRARAGPARGTSLVRDLSVDEFGDVAVVSFLLYTQGSGARGRTSTRYVVDVWQQATHRLLVRYEAAPRTSRPPPARPSGRE